MKKLLILFLFGIFFISSVSSIRWDVQYAYDEIDDSYINQTLWSNTTSCSGVNCALLNISTGENTDYMFGNSSGNGTANSSTNLVSLLIPNPVGITNMTIKSNESAFWTSGTGCTGCVVNSYLYSFGTAIKGQECTVAGCSTSDTSVWFYNKNFTTGDFNVFDDGVLQVVVTPSNSVVKLTNVRTKNGGGTDSLSAQNRFYYVYLTLNNGTMNITTNSLIPNRTANFYLRNENITFNISTTTDINSLQNITLYINGVANETKNITGTSNQTTFNKTFNNFGLYNWSVYVCDSDSNCKYSNVNTFTINGFIQNSVTYNANTYSSSNENFTLNITYDSSIYPSVNAVFYYNNTAYSSTQSGQTFLSSITIPQVSTQQTLPFYWTLAMYNGTGTDYFNTTQQNQTILLTQSIIVSSSTCSSGYSPAMYFTYADEMNLSTIYNVTTAYNINYGYAGNLTAVTTYGNVTSNSLYICVNATNPTYLVGDGELMYMKSGYQTRKFLLFENTRLTNETINNTLYLLQSSSATEFLFTLTNNFLVLQSGKFASLLRWYPELNSYKIVEMAESDDSGQFVNSIDTSGVDYRIGIYEEDGTLINLFNPVRYICQVSPCTSSLVIPSNAITLNNIGGIQQSLTYNETSKVFTYTWNDPSQDTTLMNLSVYRDQYNGTSLVCSQTSSTFTGLLTCSISAYTSGTFRAVVQRSASPPLTISSLIISLSQQISQIAQGKTMGLLLSGGLFVFSFLIGLFNPVVALIMGAVSLVPAVYVGALSIVWLIGYIILVVITIHYLRRS